MNGIHFLQCICTTHPIDRMNIKTIISNCHFLDGVDFLAMENKQKRFALYYSYSVDIYLITGKHNRCQLPNCLKAEIRGRYPKMSLETYTDDNTNLPVSNRQPSPKIKITKKLQTSLKVVQSKFRKPRIETAKYGKTDGIIFAIYKYVDLNRDKSADIKGVNVGNTGVQLTPYIDYLMTLKAQLEIDRFFVDQLIDRMTNIMQVIAEIDRSGNFKTRYKYRPLINPYNVTE